MSPARVTYRFVAVLVFIHVLAFWFAIHVKGIYMKDSFEYLNQSINLFEHGSWYAAPWNGITFPDYFSFRPPLYAIFIGAVRFLFPPIESVLVAQNILSIFNILLVYRMAMHFQLINGRREWIIIALLIASPIQLVMANMIMSEILFQSLLLLLFHGALQYWFNQKVSHVWIMALAMTLLLMTKPVAVLLLPVVIIWIGYVQWKKSIFSLQYIRILFPLLLMPLTYCLVGLQQKHQTGYFHYTSMKPFNQFKFNARFILASKYGEEVAEAWTESCKLRLSEEADYSTRYALMQHMGDSVMLKYPLTFLKLYIKGCATFLLDPGRHDLAVFLNWEDEGDKGFFYRSSIKDQSGIGQVISQMPISHLLFLAFLFLFNLISVIVFLFFVWLKNIPNFIKILCLIFLLYFIMATGILGVARYRSVLIPELWLMTMFVIDAWLKKTKGVEHV